EMVLALPNPDYRVVFLGQFSRERTNHEREHAGIQMRMRRKQDDLIDELDGAYQDRGHPGEYLRDRRQGARFERIAAEDRLEIESVLDLRIVRALEPQHHDD